MLDVRDMYAQLVAPEFMEFTKVSLNPKTLNLIDNVAEKLAQEKCVTETAYRKDGASLKTRFKTGFKGEAAVEQLLGIKVMDLTTGVSTNYDHPDIPGYLLGVKTVRHGNFPVIQKNNEYGQIICITDPIIDSIVYVCGVADADTLNTYQNEYLLLDPNLRDKGTKTGFYGFKCLKRINNLKDIEMFKSNK